LPSHLSNPTPLKTKAGVLRGEKVEAAAEIGLTLKPIMTEYEELLTELPGHK
jgi:hypothetical protein